MKNKQLQTILIISILLITLLNIYSCSTKNSDPTKNKYLKISWEDSDIVDVLHIHDDDSWETLESDESKTTYIKSNLSIEGTEYTYKELYVEYPENNTFTCIIGYYLGENLIITGNVICFENETEAQKNFYAGIALDEIENVHNSEINMLAGRDIIIFKLLDDDNAELKGGKELYSMFLKHFCSVLEIDYDSLNLN